MTAALLVIDVQKAIDHPSWGVRNNPQAESNIARLLSAWRNAKLPVYHIKHDSVEPDSTYRPGQPGNDFKQEALPRDGEPVIAKHTACAFIGTDLETRLRSANHLTLIITGVITNNSVEATARIAGCLGFDTHVVSDATFTFGRTDWHGEQRTAGEVHAMSLANLQGEYAKIIDTDEALRRFCP